ncbi:MAG: RsmB/NOP family class I SAM-dependent RNA methyltransferase [Acidobacteria bacterium]|nr:RsmB/NOP family class I SAM-dependent RNA methyltransferase [Acidobacteriota bacterium]
MMELGDFTHVQTALEDLVGGRVFIGKALSRMFRQMDLAPAEQRFWREFVYGCVQLKNRYRTIIEQFSEQHPGKDDWPLDARFFFICRYLENPNPGRVEREIYRLLSGKSRVRKLVEFLKATDTRQLFPHPKKEEAAFLWQYHSHPLWMIRKWLGLFGPAETLQLCRFNNGRPDVALRVNPLHVSRAALRKDLEQAGIPCRESDASPLGLEILGDFDPLPHPRYRRADFTLQKIASQLICFYLNPRPGQRVVDYCAGEGGKTLLLSHIMKGKGEIHAHDRQAWRLQNLKQRAKKEGIPNVRLEGLQAIQALSGSFDLVVLDVPCSGSGNFRHQPELKWKLTAESLQDYNSLQLRLLDEAAPLARAGGLMGYITCSIFQEENHKVVHRFLKLHPNWERVAPADFLRESHASEFWLPRDRFAPYLDDHYLQILPQRHDLTGMFTAILRKTS